MSAFAQRNSIIIFVWLFKKTIENVIDIY